VKRGPACGSLCVEGPKLIHEALAAGMAPLEIWSVAEPPFAADCPLYLVPEAFYEALSPARSGKPPLAFFKRPDLMPAGDLAAGRFLLLDEIQDPGNAGGLVRAAAAFAFDGVLWLEPCVSPFHFACIRASAGAVFHIRHYQAERTLADGPLPLIGTAADAPCTLQDFAWPPHLILAMGNEGRGLSDPVRTKLTASVRIPIAACVESLNVAGAAHILMYHITRSRAKADDPADGTRDGA